MQGKTVISCFRNAAEYLINDNKEYESRKENVEDEAERISTQEAKLRPMKIENVDSVTRARIKKPPAFCNFILKSPRFLILL
jgi:hypothetical protein